MRSDHEAPRLHICLGPFCNNNCLFCMEDDRESRARRLGKIDSAAVLSILEDNPGRDEVMFTSGEPTLREDLAALLGQARRLGYKRIGLITNGRRLAYRDYLDKLIDSGLNHLLISIHGNSARLHDGLTRTPGSFEQTVSGMRNVRALRAETGASGGQSNRLFSFATTTVLNRRNMALFAEMIGFFDTFEPTEKVFNIVQPLGRGKSMIDSLLPPYAELVDELRRGVERLGSVPSDTRILDIPRCVSAPLPEELLGYVEHHTHFEPEGDVLIGLIPQSLRRTDGGAPEGGAELGSPVDFPGGPTGESDLPTNAPSVQTSGSDSAASPGAISHSGDMEAASQEPDEDEMDRLYGLRLVTKRELDNAFRWKGKGCRRCFFNGSCDGVWRGYVERYGEDEFRPVVGGRNRG